MFMLSVFQNLKFKPVWFCYVDSFHYLLIDPYFLNKSLFSHLGIHSKNHIRLKLKMNTLWRCAYLHRYWIFTLRTIPNLDHFILSLFCPYPCSLKVCFYFIDQDFIQKISKPWSQCRIFLWTMWMCVCVWLCLFWKIFCKYLSAKNWECTFVGFFLSLCSLRLKEVPKYTLCGFYTPILLSLPRQGTLNIPENYNLIFPRFDM